MALLKRLSLHYFFLILVVIVGVWFLSSQLQQHSVQTITESAVPTFVYSGINATNPVGVIGNQTFNLTYSQANASSGLPPDYQYQPDCTTCNEPVKFYYDGVGASAFKTLNLSDPSQWLGAISNETPGDDLHFAYALMMQNVSYYQQVQNGTITVNATMGNGTTFLNTIPTYANVEFWHEVMQPVTSISLTKLNPVVVDFVFTRPVQLGSYSAYVTPTITLPGEPTTALQGLSWFNTSYFQCINMTINASLVALNGTYPQNINLTDSNFSKDSNFLNDYLITNGTCASAGQVQQPRDTLYYNGTSGWLEAAFLGNITNQSQYSLYFNDSSAANQENNTGVWSNYTGVWHFQNGTVANYTDSSSGSNNGTAINPTYVGPTVGPLGGAVNFSNNGPGYVNTTFLATNYPDITVSAWVNFTQTALSFTLVNQGGFYFCSLGFSLYSHNYQNAIDFSVGNGTNSMGAENDNFLMSPNVNYYIVGEYNGSSAMTYTNGGNLATSGGVGNVNFMTGTIATGSCDKRTVQMGSNFGASQINYNGSMSEIRITNWAEPAGQILTEYNDQLNASNGSFWTYSPEQYYSSGSSASQVNWTVGSNSTSTTKAGAISTFNLGFTDNSTNLNQYVFAIDNGNGTFQNQTVGTFPGATSGTATISFLLNSTVGSMIRWYVYGNDTNSPTAANTSQIFTFTTTTNWYNTSWLYCIPFVVNASQVNVTNGNFTLFPTLVNITSSSLAQYAQGNGSDFLFTNGSSCYDPNAIQIPYERDYWNNVTGQLEAWIDTPTFSNLTTGALFYGNPSIGDQQNATGVWTNGYAAVYHLGNSTNLVYANDSTSNGNNGTLIQGLVNATIAQIAGGGEL